MSLVINTNVSSLIAQRELSSTTNNLNKVFRTLSSGYRINRAADDAAGLSISETLRGQIRGTDVAINNAQDGNNVLQITEGALGSMTEHFQRIRELTVQAANDTNSTNERSAIVLEIRQRIQDINRISTSTRSNNTFLLDGSATDFTLQIGANSSSDNVLTIGQLLASASINVFGISLGDVTTSNSFSSASAIRGFLGEVDGALSTLMSRRAELGAVQNRLDTIIDNLTIQKENLTAMESRIRDADIAKETAKLTKYQILQQASLSILAQSNQAPSLALSLLGG